MGSGACARGLSFIFYFILLVKVKIEKKRSHAESGARLAYWNLLVPRSRPESLAERIQRDGARGQEMLLRDRAFVYGGFNVERVL